MQQSIKSIKGGMIYLDMDEDQMSSDLFVHVRSKEAVDKQIIKYFNSVHKLEAKKSLS